VNTALRRAPLAAAVVGGAFWAYGPGADGAAAAVCGLVLLALSLHDAHTSEIPLRYTLGGTLAALLWAAVRMGPAAAGTRALAAVGVAAGLWALARGIGVLARREVMGEGDALLLGFLSVVVGFGRIGTLLAGAATLALAVFAARLLPAPWRGPAVWIVAGIAAAGFLIGGWARLGVLALPLAAVWPRRHLAAVAEPLPFGPMLAAGAVLALFAPAASFPAAPHPASVHAPLFPNPPR
jgi:prepilin signal peptidase PulO-like enzyme (type II secretory pathway)